MSIYARFLSNVPYICGMDIYNVLMRDLSASTNDSALFAVAVNNVIPMGSGSATDKLICYVRSAPTGFKNFGTLMGGTSNPIKQVQPAFYPFATKGAECAAIVKSLDWADANLEQGYEWIQTNDSATKNYFVSGVLNSSETDFNNPFATGASLPFLNGACWEGS